MEFGDFCASYKCSDLLACFSYLLKMAKGNLSHNAGGCMRREVFFLELVQVDNEADTLQHAVKAQGAV